VVFAAAYAGWTILMSSLTRRPILSLLIGLIAFSAIWVLDLAADFAKTVGSERFAWMQYVGYALPDFYEAWLVTPKVPEMIAAIAILLGMGAVTTALSAWVVNRRDV
jgi:hypothetical protein